MSEQHFNASAIAQEMGLSTKSIYRHWRRLANDLGIPPYGCLNYEQKEQLKVKIQEISRKLKRC